MTKVPSALYHIPLPSADSLSPPPSLSPFSRPFSRWIAVSQYQNVAIFHFIGDKDHGGGGQNWSYKSGKAPVKSSPPTNQYPVLFTGRMHFLSPNQQCQSTEGNGPAQITTFHFHLIFLNITPGYAGSAEVVPKKKLWVFPVEIPHWRFPSHKQRCQSTKEKIPNAKKTRRQMTKITLA